MVRLVTFNAPAPSGHLISVVGTVDNLPAKLAYIPGQTAIVINFGGRLIIRELQDVTKYQLNGIETHRFELIRHLLPGMWDVDESSDSDEDPQQPQITN